ncbi:MAG TPA: urease subunit alpha [Candidatus Bathyarchaeia archaeon]|nr:urease subunit alpha [Candidatus Bathyarchaeia archaeon]
MASEISRSDYAARYGPTAGDRVRLGDTNLLALIERDETSYGDEVLRGWGKTLRTGMMMNDQTPADSELDLIITNVVVIDPVLGVFKANIGVKDGLIVGVGRAGNPDVIDDPDLLIGSATAVIYGGGFVATPGGIDTHVHLVQPRLIPAALGAGMTTLITGGLNDNPAFNLERMFQAFEHQPVNLGVLGRAASTVDEPLVRQIESGACGLKVHEDYAGYPSVIDRALSVAEVYDVQIAMHTDGINESCELHETVAAIGARTIHAYHVEGIGGGHAPDILAIAGVANVIGSSTTPTIPYGRNVVAEHHAMMWSVHGMNPHVPSDRAMIADRIRESTMRAESVLHELGAISIINSDSQGMGRIAEVIRRTWQLAHQMKIVAGGAPAHDNPRILKYLAKYTINPARAHGVDRWVGSLEAGKVADIVLWKPQFFGVKPELVIKGGYPAWGALGEGNASIPLAEPPVYGPHWGGSGIAAASLSANFVSAVAAAGDFGRRASTRRRALGVVGTRRVSKRHMLYNQTNPKIDIDPRTAEIAIDGRPLPPLPGDDLPLNRRYFLL